jgi:DNA-binding transcriptional LysR family regulator
MSTYRSLPPLSTLIGFEAAARLQSFSRAAEELHITQSAISHQVRVLEDHLGQPLFRRIGRRIELVDAGRDFLITARSALEELRHGVRRLNAYSKPGSVIVMMPGALATGWFIPRLVALREAHPWIDPWVHTSDETHVPEEAEIDIVLGPVPWADPGAQSLALAEDRLIPLCAPSLAESLSDLPEAQRLDAAPLLHGFPKWAQQGPSSPAATTFPTRGRCCKPPFSALASVLRPKGWRTSILSKDAWSNRSAHLWDANPTSTLRHGDATLAAHQFLRSGIG